MQTLTKRRKGKVKPQSNGNYNINFQIDKHTYKSLVEVQQKKGLSTLQELIRVLVKKCIATS